MSRFEQRRDKLRQLIRRQGTDAMLVTHFVNVTYLTGFTGDDSFLLMTGQGEVMISDSRYSVQLEEECPGLDVDIRLPGVPIVDAVARVVKRAKLPTLAIEAQSMTVGLYERIRVALPKTELVSTSGLVERLRQIKDREEVDQIRRAVRNAERAFGVVRASLREDQTEKHIADELDHQVRLFGGRCCSFPSVVAVGPRAALPHATPTAQRVGGGDFVLIDWGAVGGLYMSDLTRILVTGRISSKLRRVYQVVLKAQRRAIAAIKPRVTLERLDGVARRFIARAGYEKNFRHGLGHGIGLEIHEAPRVAPGQHQPLEPGMVVTVEPGIYLPGWGGVRVEDDVLVTRTGHEVLSSVGKELEECVVA
jgi:Xaa-Pro aminopeptidase